MSMDQALSFSRVIGQDQAIRQLKQGLITKRISHAYLFAGPEGVGKEKTAMALAAALNCARQNEGEACGRCRNCMRLGTGNYPDFFFLQPKGTTIRIEQIRGIQARLSLASFEGYYRIILIGEADKMTEEAANSLLKLLEEPPQSTVFILLTTLPAAILPTILSRCVEVRFLSLLPAVIKRLLLERGFAADIAERLANTSGGSISQAIQRGANPEADTNRLKAVKIISSLRNASMLDLISLAGEMEQEENLEEVLDWMVWLYRDLLVSRQGGPDRLVLNKDQLADVDKISPMVGVAEMIEEIVAIRRMLQKNINKRLGLENMLISLQEKFLIGG
ncbi:MAG: DNA polymerase III subunit delta' [Syntrophomonadaceae bacterium]|nr:DNA polymerase III subunit delta' [Syntrophomonadaceae bacterium]